MKILRTVTRRGDTVRTAGFFTILSPNRWFAASKLPEGYRFLDGQPKGTAAQIAAELAAVDRSNSQETTAPQIIIPSEQNHHLMRLALSALAAIAITFFMLWWIERA
jgi:hypothetical protein